MRVKMKKILNNNKGKKKKKDTEKNENLKEIKPEELEEE